jgi:cold shock CspA family protein
VKGTMIWFHEARGSGFLLSDDGERLPVDREAFVNGGAPVGRCSGLPVTFRLGERDGEPIAVDVSFVEALNPRRARRRSSGMRGGS